MANIARFSAVKSFPVNWRALGLKSAGIKVIVEITTGHPITPEYLDMIARELENARSPGETYLCDVKPIYQAAKL